MKKKRHFAATAAAVMVAALAMSLPALASAHEGEYAKFNYCPSTNAEVTKCIYSVVEGGKFVLGSKSVPIVNPVVLQGGYGKADKETHYSKFYEATNGVTLSKSPQPVPGGLAGLVNCKEIGNWLLKITCEGVFENGVTGVNSTLELAKPASEIQISERSLLLAEGPALRLPVKVHLENPLLGANCYVGSSGSPIWLNLTTGTTAPPPPNEPITGSVGTSAAEAEGILSFHEQVLVDNAWSAPGASGCGGPILEYVLDPILNLSAGVPSAAGKNTAIQETTTYTSPTRTVNAH